jgi:hypothetical protein
MSEQLVNLHPLLDHDVSLGSDVEENRKLQIVRLYMVARLQNA